MVSDCWEHSSICGHLLYTAQTHYCHVNTIIFFSPLSPTSSTLGFSGLNSWKCICHCSPTLNEAGFCALMMSDKPACQCSIYLSCWGSLCVARVRLQVCNRCFCVCPTFFCARVTEDVCVCVWIFKPCVCVLSINECIMYAPLPSTLN